MANPNPKKAFVETGAGDVVEDGHLLGASYIAGDGAPPLPVFTAKVSAAEAVARLPYAGSEGPRPRLPRRLPTSTRSSVTAIEQVNL